MQGVCVFRTTNQSTPFDYYDTGETAYQNNGVITFDTEVYDDAAAWGTAAATKFVIPAAWDGKRGVFYASGIWSDDTTYCELKIFKNANLTEPIAVAQHASGGANTGVHLVSRPYVLATGDYFELCARSGDAATCQAQTDYSIMFALEVRS